MKTELFRQLLGKWVIVRGINSNKCYTLKFVSFSDDEELIYTKSSNNKSTWIPIKNCILVGVEEKGE